MTDSAGERAHILITGGAGFVGSNLALHLRERFPSTRITAFDNLHRRGSEMNLGALSEAGVTFLHGDIRHVSDLSAAGEDLDLIVDCSAEPSAVAGYVDQPAYVVDTNLLGTINCLELARTRSADLLFLSTSRVYPTHPVNCVAFVENHTRYSIAPNQTQEGVSERGISEGFTLDGPRTLYGATKLCSELLIQEYVEMYGLRAIVNRCGVVAGPRQMGTVEQGVFTLWVARHYFKRPLRYIGWGGTGKQVRDLLAVDDLARLIEIQIGMFRELSGATFNVGGGVENSLSLFETTQLCRQITGNSVPVTSNAADRPGDVRIFITDSAKVQAATRWTPARSPSNILSDIHTWIHDNERSLRQVWAP